jgi:hypothetical protein
MELRICGETLYGLHQPERCENCGERLPAWVPACPHCETKIEPRLRRTADGLAKAPAAVRLAHLSDLHISSTDEGKRARDCLFAWLETLRGAAVDVVAISGDLVERGGDRDSLEIVRLLLDRAGLPWVVVPGNHDLWDARDNRYHLQAFEDVFGIFPRVENRTGVSFLLCNSNQVEGGRLLLERIAHSVSPFTEGTIGQEQRERLEADLGKVGAGPRVLLLHHHVVPHPPEPFAFFGHDELAHTMKPVTDAHALNAWAHRQSVRLMLHGHKHRALPIGFAAGVMVSSGGSSTRSDPRVPGLPGRIFDLSNKDTRVLDVRLI